jgi:mono/diheme cytochrome c family protein
MRIHSTRFRVLAMVALAPFAACRHGAGAGPATTTSAVVAMPAQALPRPALVTTANVALGDSLFNNGACQRCHGKGGVGAPNGPALDGKKWVQLQAGSYDEIVKIITEGVPQGSIKDPAHKFAMRPRGGPMNLTDPQIQALAAYIWTLSHR